MNPDNMKEYNNLLWLGVKKKDRDSVRGSECTVYLDPTHVCILQLTVPPQQGEGDRVYTHFRGEEEGDVRIPDLRNDA